MKYKNIEVVVTKEECTTNDLKTAVDVINYVVANAIKDGLDREMISYIKWVEEKAYYANARIIGTVTIKTRDTKQTVTTK